MGNPTSALDIADATLKVAAVLHGDKNFDAFGVYHLAGTGETSWSGFARHVLSTSRALGGPYAAVKDLASSAYPTKARRPANSRLTTAKFASVFGWAAPDWQQSTKLVVRRILEGGNGLISTPIFAA
ncbi:dTDP-4-dehydrorhamnose reductase [Mesorhizobium robiniae]|uniref:dTDP-4-dehydrorhamnose reductase n=1 Tax=Mesorhizobium robiniae TaxID=559315 RepID=A0ABV2GQS0_9HYPH